MFVRNGNIPIATRTLPSIRPAILARGHLLPDPIRAYKIQITQATSKARDWDSPCRGSWRTRRGCWCRRRWSCCWWPWSWPPGSGRRTSGSRRRRSRRWRRTRWWGSRGWGPPRCPRAAGPSTGTPRTPDTGHYHYSNRMKTPENERESSALITWNCTLRD